jgi:hypothetical protein
VISSPFANRPDDPCDHHPTAFCSRCAGRDTRLARDDEVVRRNHEIAAAGQCRTSAALLDTVVAWYLAFFADDYGEDILSLFD